MDVIYASVAFLLICFLAGLGVALGRYFVLGGWHYRIRHSCGYHTEWSFFVNPCARCGEGDGNWETRTARALFPIGWQWRPLKEGDR